MAEVPGPPPGSQGAVSIEITGTGPAVSGKTIVSSFETPSLGFLGGVDPVFSESAGVYGESGKAGVFGNSNSQGGTGVHARGGGDGGFGVRGEVGNGVAAVQGQSFGTGLAGKFIGNVEVHGNLTMGNNGDVILADCAEEFDVFDTTNETEPGSVMVLDETGAIRPCDKIYDKSAIGVISGAGTYRPAIVLDRVPSATNRAPIALVGKVYCKVDATFAPVEVGDLLTTSPNIGHAMKAVDPLKAFGAVIGKALKPLPGGHGLIPILVSLQ